MTAKEAGSLAAEGLFATLRRLRDQWVLLVFLATALFWTRDLYERFVDLPHRVAEMQEAIGKLGVKISRLETVSVKSAADRSPVLAFPGGGHQVGDGAPGDHVTVQLRPVRWSRKDCRLEELDAYAVDADAVWHTVPTDLRRLPHLMGPQSLAFGVSLPRALRPGRAQLLVQATLDCGTHKQVESAPRLHFRVLPPKPDTAR